MSFARDHDILVLTRTGRAALVPEITLHLARDPTGIFTAAERIERPGVALPPYWAFAWPGGQATARYLLDHPEVVAGKRVIDIGAGSGIAAIAAAKAGATSVLAADIDPLAIAAIGLNAQANGVAISATAEDILGRPPRADVILIGDLVYDPELATRVDALLEAARRSGAELFIADRASARRPTVAVTLVAEYGAPLVPPLPAHAFEQARIWQLQRAPRRKPAQSKERPQ